MVLVADDLGAWLVFILAEAGRKKLTTLVFGHEQGRALRPAATEAVQLTAADLCQGDAQRTEELAIMIGPLFKTPVPGAPLGEQATVLETLQVAISEQLKLLDNPALTATLKSLTGMPDMSATIVAQKLTEHLLREISGRASRGGPLEPLGNQLNHDRTYLMGLRVEGKIDQLDDRLVDLLARMGETCAMTAAPVALAQLPAVTAGFTGRDDELTVLAGLLDPASAGGPVLVSAVAGLAGVGKTTLAVAAGHAARERGWFGGGVLFIDLHGYDDQRVQPGQALDALLRALGVPAEDIPPTVEERAGLYRSVLAQIHDPALVIADNASAEAQVRPLLPGTGPHKVLVTSRHTLAGLGARLVDVTVLDDDASLALLDAALRAARPDDGRITRDPQVAGQLAGICGGLPLALQITAALLVADPALTPGELADQLEDQSQRLDALRYDDGSDISAPSVAAAFGLSCRKLDDTSARVFRLLAVAPGPDVSTETAAVLADVSAPQVRTVLSGLAAAHLIECAPGVAGRWRMHDLVRLYGQRLANQHGDSDDQEQALDRLLDYWLEITQAANDHVLAVPDTNVSDTFGDAAEALAWLDTERASLIAAIQVAAATRRDWVAMALPMLMAEYLDRRRLFDDKIAAMEISLLAARRLGDELREADALTIRGNALPELRRFEEAITAHQDAIAIFRRVGGRSGEANALMNLALALWEVDRFHEATVACEDAVAIHREAPNRRGEADALAILSYSLLQINRDEEAIAIGHDAITIYRKIGDQRGEAGALNNLGLALQGAHRFEEAITAHHDSAALFRATGERHGEAGALTNLGTALQVTGRFEEAITAHQDAAAIYREAGDQKRYALVLDNLGTALRATGRFEEAITAHQDAAAIYREAGDQKRYALVLNNLGTALRATGRFEEAITAQQDAAAIWRETGDRDCEAEELNNLGTTLQDTGRFEEAITAYQDAAAIYRERGEESQCTRLDDLERPGPRSGSGLRAVRYARLGF